MGWRGKTSCVSVGEVPGSWAPGGDDGEPRRAGLATAPVTHLLDEPRTAYYRTYVLICQGMEGAVF